jgi:hypothetical protein
MPRKDNDGVEAALKRADATLDDWYRQSRMTTQQAAVVFARFLDRAKREGAGALRQQVDGLQVGLKKLSAGLEQMERSARPARRKRSVASTRTRTRTAARRRKKAA